MGSTRHIFLCIIPAKPKKVVSKILAGSNIGGTTWNQDKRDNCTTNSLAWIEICCGSCVSGKPNDECEEGWLRTSSTLCQNCTQQNATGTLHWYPLVKCWLGTSRKGLDPLNYGWKEKNGYYTPDWFFRPSLPEYIFHEGEREKDSIEDHLRDQSDVATVFENDADSNSENAWIDDSESEADI